MVDKFLTSIYTSCEFLLPLTFMGYDFSYEREKLHLENKLTLV